MTDAKSVREPNCQNVYICLERARKTHIEGGLCFAVSDVSWKRFNEPSFVSEPMKFRLNLFKGSRTVSSVDYRELQRTHPGSSQNEIQYNISNAEHNLDEFVL